MTNSESILYGFVVSTGHSEDGHVPVYLMSTCDQVPDVDAAQFNSARNYAAGMLARIGMMILAEVEIIGQVHKCSRRAYRFDSMVASREGCHVDGSDLDAWPPGLGVTVPANLARSMAAYLGTCLDLVRANVSGSAPVFKDAEPQ